MIKELEVEQSDADLEKAQQIVDEAEGGTREYQNPVGPAG